MVTQGSGCAGDTEVSMPTVVARPELDMYARQVFAHPVEQI
jgi:hypothetical protein